MSRSATISQRILSKLRTGPGRLVRLLNQQNFRKLAKALREEPPDLILENFWKLIRTGKAQDPYPPQFIDRHADLKFHILHCRKEKGVLKVTIWVLSRNGLQKAALFAGEQLLTTSHFNFAKPELTEMYSAFADYRQQGLIFEWPFDGSFPDLILRLQDHRGHTLEFPIGRFSLKKRENKAASLTVEKGKGLKKKVIVLFTDWGLPALRWQQSNPVLQDKQLVPDWVSEVLLVAQTGSGKVATGDHVTRLNRQQINDYLQRADFHYLLHLSPDTLLPADFFPFLQSFLDQHPNADLLYFDEALLEGEENYHSATLKPAFSPEYLAVDNYLGSNICISSSLVRKLDRFTEQDADSGLYTLLLSSLEQQMEVHRVPGAMVFLPDNPKAIYEAIDASRQAARVSWTEMSAKQPQADSLVSIIIPFKDQVELLATCLESIYRHTEYTRFEILLISNNSEEKKTYEFLESAQSHYPEVRSLRWDHPFNYAALNNWAVGQARGEVLLFLNNDVEVLTGHWLKKMLSYLHSPEVGAVGAKLLYPDDTVQHAGVIIGIGGIAAHAHKHLPAALGGYAGRAGTVQNVSAVTAACLLIRRSVFASVSGFDAKNLPIAFNDVDLCLKVRAAGYRIVYCPEVVLYHYESISRGAEDTSAKRRRARKEIRFFRRKWRSQIRSGDPYYHPGFTDRRADFEE